MKNLFIEYIMRNMKEIIIITLIMFIGLILGVIYINNVTGEKREKIENYTKEIITNIKEYKSIQEKEKMNILKSNLERNLTSIIVLGIVSSSILGMPIMYMYIARKTFSLGYTMSSIIATLGRKGGSIFICIVLVLHNIIYLIRYIRSFN